MKLRLTSREWCQLLSIRKQTFFKRKVRAVGTTGGRGGERHLFALADLPADYRRAIDRRAAKQVAVASVMSVFQSAIVHGSSKGHANALARAEWQSRFGKDCSEKVIRNWEKRLGLDRIESERKTVVSKPLAEDIARAVVEQFTAKLAAWLPKILEGMKQ